MTDPEIRRLVDDGTDRLREVSGRGRWPRFVRGNADPRDRRTAMVRLIDGTRDELTALAAAFSVGFQRGRMTLDGWAKRFLGILGAGQVAAAMAAIGAAALPPADLDTAIVAVDEQRRYFDGFRRDLEIGAVLLLAPRPLGALGNVLRGVSPGVANRSAMYGESLWQAGQDVLRANMRRAGYDEERRVLGEASRHCSVCPALARLGWQPIGSLPRIGESPCRIHCRCGFLYRDSRNPRQEINPLPWAA